MKLKILLFTLGKIFQVASMFNKKFRHYIRKSGVRILIKTADGSCGRLFIFDKGKFSSLPGNHDDFDAALIWQDSSTGFSVMTSKKPDAFFNAAADGKLSVEGMSFYAQWFEDGTKLLL